MGINSETPMSNATAGTSHDSHGPVMSNGGIAAPANGKYICFIYLPAI